MSEMNMNTGFQVPENQDFNTETFQGSMQQVLADNVGSYVLVEFLIGTGQLTTKQGLLYYVGAQFLALLDELEDRMVICDIFAVKFVTFLLPDGGLLQDRNDGSTETPAVTASAGHRAELRTPGQAAYAHATRKNIRR